MADRRGNGAPRYVRTLFEAGTIGGLSDEQLLGRFAGRRDEAAELAFAVLVERHGPMVLRVCRAVLRDEHDAQDAFQATFLVLARRARSLWVRDSLGPWLHGVALRASSCMKAAATRRRKHEGMAASSATARVADGGDDLASALDEEIGRLPRLYRAPVVLCHLEGLSHDQAARVLGCPVGTVRSRLARGRERLRDRLARRGLAPMAATRAAEVPPGPAAVMPVALVEATTRASLAFEAGPAAAGTVPATVINLAKGAIGAMWLAKMQWFAAGAVACAVVAVGLGTWGHGSVAQEGAKADTGRGSPLAADEASAPARPATVLVAAEQGSGGAQPESRREGGTPARRPADWGGGGAGYELSRDEATKHGGQASGSIRSLGDEGDGFGTFTQGFRADRYRGKRLRVSAYARSENVEGWAGLWMRIDGRDKGGLAFDNMEGRPIKGTTDWRKYEVVLDVPQGAEDIFFGFLLAGAGRAWVDDIAFDVVGQDVSSTDLKLEPTDNDEGPAPGLPKEPRNLDFERGGEVLAKARRPATSAPRRPVFWGGGGAGYELSRDETVKHAGQASGSVRSLRDAGDGFGTFTQGIRADRYRGKRLRMSAYARSENVEGSAGLWMRIDGREKASLAFDNMMNRPIKGTTDWHKYEVVLDVPQGAEDIFFGFLLAGTGRAWVDDIAFDVVGQDVASTGLDIQPQDRAGGASPDLPQEPRNLDFER